VTQTEQVLALLQERGPRGLTPLEALELAGSFRLAARINDLREEGHDILTEWVRANGKKFARYVLADSPKPEPIAVGQVELGW
jgi:hypothetical protein